jgi:predicted DNA-binding transcriptional regulator AlpA
MQTTIPSAARNLDSLPDSALVDIAVVLTATSKSRATIYRWIDRGHFPKPRKIGNSQNLWSVGDIRRVLAGN